MEDFLENFHNSLGLPTILCHNFTKLIQAGNLSIFPLSISDISSSHQNETKSSHNFTLKIPYAGRKLTWDVIFNPEDIEFAPDFHFNDENFTLSQDLLEIIDNIPSLADWNVHDENALHSVLSEFIELYKRQNEEKMRTETIYLGILKQYEKLIDGNDIRREDVEVMLDGANAYFLIRARVDLGGLPPYFQENKSLVNPSADVFLLKVHFNRLQDIGTPTLRNHTTSMQLPSRLEQLIGSTRNFQIPTFNSEMTLSYYVTQVAKSIEKQLNAIRKSYNERKRFFTLLSSALRSNVIEFDADTFSQATFLLEDDDFYFLMHISVGDTFPLKKPNVEVCAVDCACLKSDVCAVTVKDYSFVAAWAMEENLNCLFRTIRNDVLPKMKQQHQVVAQKRPLVKSYRDVLNK